MLDPLGTAGDTTESGSRGDVQKTSVVVTKDDKTVLREGTSESTKIGKEDGIKE